MVCELASLSTSADFLTLKVLRLVHIESSLNTILSAKEVYMKQTNCTRSDSQLGPYRDTLYHPSRIGMSVSDAALAAVFACGKVLKSISAKDVQFYPPVWFKKHNDRSQVRARCFYKYLDSGQAQ